MEQIKKQQIINTAMRIFKEKGYFAASMQDIAEACGMAKGSIYKVFPSKEDLFTGVFTFVHRTMFEQARELDRSLRLAGDPPKEILRRKIEFQLQYMLENHFFTSEFKELPITANENFQVEWKKKRAAFLTWHRDCFYEAYGDSISPYLGDIVAIYRGMSREYLSHAVQTAIACPMAELARFCVDRMDAVIRDMIDKEPVPILKVSSAYFNDINPVDLATRRANLGEFLQYFAQKVQELPQPERIQKELLEVIDLLRRELKQDKPNATLVRVYTNFLDSVDELRPYVRQLGLMLNHAAEPQKDSPDQA
ncbi:helix-turn-helix domain containing protein [Paenibacillus favisporus]|uniref:TetR/AcrR family transcriptional regulator n=1 Tax=Paenibacillus favisporus TaxID=221028 RepID=UPI002DB8850B|nr:helix-turn-helix domain-containing protein [Paenibacillus favisporus]MEC0173700.1 helix-turn-helix domain containing protein [Paenibacillus favisporus]